ncbi:MAG: hypothetical protein LBJ02_10735 [Bifidobacteriaceae bacterium]|nr:hypothetical protein [Bifidobacteriaceae bacterium]
MVTASNAQRLYQHKLSRPMRLNRDVAALLSVSESTVCRWRAQQEVD